MAAPICTNCPDLETLQHVLDCSLSDDAQSRVVAHLDACEVCQKKIENVAAGGFRLMECAAQARRSGPENNSAYWPALRELERQVVKVAHAPLGATMGEGDDGTATLDDISLDFLDQPEQPGTLGKLGRFHVVEVVGRGGMGIVLRALDACLQRQVALKVLDPKFARNDLARNRFIREARAAASIAHENVVAIHSVEKHRSEVPYLVMRLVTGESLQERLDRQEGALSLREILRIGEQTAAGLAAAHEQELIHRDIKPANILLEAGTNKVMLTDFGLARAVEDARLTQTGLVAGTPLYMSPEQARGETLDHRSDLFSFGSVLYAMCTGSPPFQGSSPFVVLREVTEGNHRPIHETNPSVPDELAAIIDHLLAKKPDDRIQSADEVAELLEQLLVKLPPDRTTGPVRRTSRSLPRFSRSWWGRNGALIGMLVIAANLLLLVSEWTKLTHWTLLGQRGGAAATAVNDVAGPKPLFDLDARTGPVWSVAFSPDGNSLAMAVNDGSVQLWNARTGALMSTIPAHKGIVWSVAYDRDGSQIATAGDDGWVKLWDPHTSNDLDRFESPNAVRIVAFSPDGKYLATGTRTGAVRVWDAKTLKSVIATQGHNAAVLSLAFSPDGKLLASSDDSKTIKIWDVSNSDGKEITTFRDHVGPVYSVAFHPTRKILASGSWDRSIRLWDIEKNQQIAKLEGHREDVRSVAFAPDGVHLVSGSEDRTAKLWDINSGKEEMTFKGHVSTIYNVAISKDGKRVATASRDGTVKLWDLP